MVEAECTKVAGYDFFSEATGNAQGRDPLFWHGGSTCCFRKLFDVIRLNHIIEHLTDYPHTLGMLRSLLDNGGILMG